MWLVACLGGVRVRCLVGRRMRWVGFDVWGGGVWWCEEGRWDLVSQSALGGCRRWNRGLRRIWGVVGMSLRGWEMGMDTVESRAELVWGLQGFY